MKSTDDLKKKSTKAASEFSAICMSANCPAEVSIRGCTEGHFTDHDDDDDDDHSAVYLKIG